MRILLGCTYITAGAYSMRWRGGKGTIICSTLHEPRFMWVHGLRFLRHVAHQSCAFWVFNIYMFVPHSKRWWLSSRTHLSGYERYRCFPSMGPLGPSLLFAWQQERLIWLRRGLLFLLWDDMDDTVWAHTHMHVYAWIHPIESKWLVQRHIMNRSRSVWGASVRFLTHAPHQCCVFKHACTHHLHTYACSGWLRTVHSPAWLSATSLYIRGPAWTSMITLTNNKIGYHGRFFIWFVLS